MSIVHSNSDSRRDMEIVSESCNPLDMAITPTALESITRAEIDTQVSTAKRYPRSISRFFSEAKTIVAMDITIAEKCTFVLPKKDRDGKKITGPSIRLAEICHYSWGNLSVATRIVGDDGRFLKAQAVAIDYERNNRFIVEVDRGITTSEGRRFGDDMIKVTAMAAQSIASRNAIFKVVPLSFVKVIQDEAKRVATGDIKTLPARTEARLAGLAQKGISEDRVFAALGIAGASDMTLDLLADLNGYATAAKDGMAKLEEIFPPIKTIKPETTPAATGDSKSAALAARSKANREPGEEG